MSRKARRNDHQQDPVTLFFEMLRSAEPDEVLRERIAEAEAARHQEPDEVREPAGV